VRVAAVQINSDDEPDRNIEAAEKQVRAAAAAGAELVALPEKWSLLGPGELLAERAEPLDDSAAVAAARAWARELGIDLLAGSVAERRDGDERVANTSLLIDREGGIVAAYRKIHMFDVDVGGVSYRESEHEAAGDEIVLATAGGLEVGLSVCYDLRFPELYRILALRGARLITVPSAFTATTGEAHWEPLIRARAIENQLFIVAPGQHGQAPPHYDSWGHSMIVDPWGRVLAELERGDGFVVAELDLDQLARVRRDLPSLANRRPDTYLFPDSIGSHA
jgi:predicted amidohydrolase